MALQPVSLCYYLIFLGFAWGGSALWLEQAPEIKTAQRSFFALLYHLLA